MPQRTRNLKAPFFAGLVTFLVVLAGASILNVNTFVSALDLNPAGPGDELITLHTMGPILGLSVNPVADSEVEVDSPDTNNGTAKDISVISWLKNGTTPKDSRIFLQFDVSSVPAGAMVKIAKLILCSSSIPSETRTYELHRVTASWGETSITWNNQPGVAASPTFTSLSLASNGCQWFDVSDDIQSFTDGTANYGWRLWDTVEGASTSQQTKYDSNEKPGAQADGPLLQVFYLE